MPTKQLGRRMMADRHEAAFDVEARHLAAHRVLEFERHQPLGRAAADETVNFLVPQHRDVGVREQPFLQDLLGAQAVAAVDQRHVVRMVGKV